VELPYIQVNEEVRDLSEEELYALWSQGQVKPEKPEDPLEVSNPFATKDSFAAKDDNDLPPNSKDTASVFRKGKRIVTFSQEIDESEDDKIPPEEDDDEIPPFNAKANKGEPLPNRAFQSKTKTRAIAATLFSRQNPHQSTVMKKLNKCARSLSSDARRSVLKSWGLLQKICRPRSGGPAAFSLGEGTSCCMVGGLWPHPHAHHSAGPQAAAPHPFEAANRGFTRGV